MAALLPDSTANCKMMHHSGFSPFDAIALVSNLKSSFDCSLLCYRHSSCSSVSYIEDTEVCFLHETVVSDEKQLDQTVIQFSRYIIVWCTGKSIVNVKPIPSGSYRGCGISVHNSLDQSLSMMKRIIGQKSFKAPPYSTPWAGIIKINGKTQCGITLISINEADRSTRFGITAGHCLEDYGFGISESL